MFAPLLLLLLPLFGGVLSMGKMPPPVKDYAGFARDCTINGDTDCQFSGSGDAKLYFACKTATMKKENKFCFCETGNPPQDELMWPLEWDRKTEKCVGGMGAPCGTDNGLSISCKQGMECLEGRCRNPKHVHGALTNAFCNDDLDCKEGLQCRESVTPTMLKIKRCYTSS